MGGASRAIGRLGVEVSLRAVAASAGVSLGGGVSVISLSALVALDEASVALENLRGRERESRSAGVKDKTLLRQCNMPIHNMNINLST